MRSDDKTKEGGPERAACLTPNRQDMHQDIVKEAVKRAGWQPSCVDVLRLKGHDSHSSEIQLGVDMTKSVLSRMRLSGWVTEMHATMVSRFPLKRASDGWNLMEGGYRRGLGGRSLAQEGAWRPCCSLFEEALNSPKEPVMVLSNQEESDDQ